MLDMATHLYRHTVMCCITCLPLFREHSGAKNDSQSQKVHEQHQRISEQFEGVTGHYPVKQGVLRQITPEFSTESSAKSLSRSFFVVPCLSPKHELRFLFGSGYSFFSLKYLCGHECERLSVQSIALRKRKRQTIGGSFLLTVGAFLLTVKLLCLQSLKALIRRTFPL